MPVQYLDTIGYFLLILLRMSGIFVLSPVLGRATIPLIARLGLSLMLSIIMLSILPQPLHLPTQTLLSFVLRCALELLAGLALGYITTLFFSAVFLGGHMIDMQIGLGMVQIFDPQTNIQVPIVGSLFNLILLEVFLISNGHLKLIQIMFEFFSVVPPGMVAFDKDIAMAVLAAFVRAFVLGVTIAIPFVASGYLAEAGFGILVRIAPQLNIFVIGIPVKTVIGLVMLGLIVPAFVTFTNVLLDEFWAYTDMILSALIPPD